MDGLQLYQQLFTRTPSTTGRKKLDHGSLPTPLQYLARWGIEAKQKGEWLSIRCPVHKSGAEKNPSMRVSAIDGHFKCMACGTKGGDVIALHRLVTGMGFIDAVNDLRGKFHD